jgi:hypothetical protein
MGRSCEPDNDPPGSLKCWELPSGAACVLSSGAQLHKISYENIKARSSLLSGCIGVKYI